MYQQITLIGNLGADPELRYTPDGTPVCNFRLAVHKHWVSDDGDKSDKTTWFRVTSWRRQAEIVNQYLAKGRSVLVIGTMEQPQPYINRAGEPVANLEVTANVVRFLNGDGAVRPTGDATQFQGEENIHAGANHAGANYAGANYAGANHAEGSRSVEEMDIPF